MARTTRRFPTEWIVVCAQVAAAAVLLGRPDLGAAGRLLSSTYPDSTGVIAASEIIVEGAIVVLAVVLVATRLRRPRPPMQLRTLALVTAALGLVSFGAGLHHHDAVGFAGCCGDVRAAQQSLGGTR